MACERRRRLLAGAALLVVVAAAGCAPALRPAATTTPPPAGAAQAAEPAPPATWVGTVTFRSEDRQQLDGTPENHSASVARTEIVATLLPGASSALVATRSTTRIDATETSTEPVECPGGAPAAPATRTLTQVMTQSVDGLGAGAVRVTPGEGGRYVVALAVPKAAGGLTSIDTRTTGTGGCDGRGGPGLGPPRALTLQAYEEPSFEFKVEGAFDPARPAAARGQVEVGDAVFAWDLARRAPTCDEVRAARAEIAGRVAAARRDALETQSRLGVEAAEAAAEIAATLQRGGLHDGRGEDALAALNDATGALGPFDAPDDAAYAAALATMVGSAPTQRALAVLGDAVLLEPLPHGEAWLLAAHDLRRLSAQLDALTAIQRELAARCP